MVKIRDQESRIAELPTAHPFPAVIGNGNVRARGKRASMGGLRGTQSSRT